MHLVPRPLMAALKVLHVPQYTPVRRSNLDSTKTSVMIMSQEKCNTCRKNVSQVQQHCPQLLTPQSHPQRALPFTAFPLQCAGVEVRWTGLLCGLDTSRNRRLCADVIYYTNKCTERVCPKKGGSECLTTSKTIKSCQQLKIKHVKCEEQL
jgi:hypothetical protein